MSAVRGRRVLIAEVALLAVSISVVVGFGRVFTASSWVVPLSLAALATHGISALVRRLSLGVALQALTVAVGIVLLVSWALVPDTLGYGLPTSASFSELGTGLEDAGEEYPEVRAPIEASDGFLLASMVGIALVALMADVAAFTLRAPLQALVPPFTLFALCSLLGGGDGRIASAAVFVVAALSFVLSMRSIDAATSTTWLPGDDRRGPQALMRLGGALIGVTAVLAVLVGPALPGAADDALWSWRGGGGPSARIINSPLVDIKSRIVNQSAAVAFTVESPEPSYWRQMALDEFDGRRWRISTSFRRVDGSFGPLDPARAEDAITQVVQIRQLGSEYLPAAFEPVAIEAQSGEVTWDDRSSTLLLDRRAWEGFEYSVRSVLPDHTADQLRQHDDQPSAPVRERYLQVPDMDPRVGELAAQLTDGAETRYDMALALQNHFRENFEYSIETPEGSGGDDIVDFLFDRRSGYCEQFAASFAAMARLVGLPSRVAVGFTEGDQSRARPGFFTVRGRDSHAWPEIYFTGIGWVPFEPTPGRFAPGTEPWTSIAPEVAEAPQEPTETTVPPEATDTTLPDLSDMLPEGDLAGGGAAASDQGFTVHPALKVALGVVGAVAAWILAVAGLVRLRRDRRRRRAAGDPSARVAVAWAEAVDALARRGREPRSEETYGEYAHRVGVAAPRTAPELRELAQLATIARYSPSPASAEEVLTAIDLSDDVVRGTTVHLPRWRRLLAAADPRVLVPTRTGGGRRHAVVASTT